MFYGSGTDVTRRTRGRRARGLQQQRAAVGREMMSWTTSWTYDVKYKIRLRQSMRIYLINDTAKFHPDPIWNVRALGFFDEVRPNKNPWNIRMSSAMWSVPVAKII